MKYLVAVFCLAVVAGCATAPRCTLDVGQPKPIVVDNERYYEIPYDQVWPKLVEELSKSFFVINNISKESNLINLSFSAKDPENYVDCGTSTRTYKGETYTYAIAGPGFYKMARQAGSNAFYEYSVNRDTDLEGRINVYVAPRGSGTKVSVNVRYVITVASTGTAETIAGALRISHGHQVIPKETATISFSSNQEDPDGEVSCYSVGRLESLILDMVE